MLRLIVFQVELHFEIGKSLSH